MISGLIDELNKSADEWNGSNMFELARMCRNAAYTILETRNDAELLRRMWKQARLEAQGFKAENAKLRESVRRLMTQRDERLARAESDNAKLRELVRDYERCSVHADCSMCEYDGKLSTHCPFSPCFPDADELRELGVEVNDG